MTREDHTPLRKFRMRKEVWDAYGAVVGPRGRSEDLVAYIEWRITHPDTPLPKRRSTRPAAQNGDDPIAITA
jgi:hypothetical protein